MSTPAATSPLSSLLRVRIKMKFSSLVSSSSLPDFFFPFKKASWLDSLMQEWASAWQLISGSSSATFVMTEELGLPTFENQDIAIHP